MPSDSPWLTLADAAAYASGDSRTATGHVRIGPRFLKKQIVAGRLRAVQVGGRKQVLTRRDWIDAWILDQETPTTSPVVMRTRRAG